MSSGGTESSVLVVSFGLGAQRWMTVVNARIIYGMTGGDEHPLEMRGDHAECIYTYIYIRDLP